MQSFVQLLALAASASAIAVDRTQFNKRCDTCVGNYPFGQIVAFGDELTDNGAGAFAHGIAEFLPLINGGAKAWTNGDVAVGYLAKLLGSGLLDYAFGGSGLASFGATIDGALTASPAGAQSVAQQIANYTGSGAGLAKESLGFIWAGMNDIAEHTNAFNYDDPINGYFYGNISASIAAQVTALFEAGVETVLVANLFPKHLAPIISQVLCGVDPLCAPVYGKIIASANAAIYAELELLPKFADIIFYDAFGFIESVVKDAETLGFTVVDAAVTTVGLAGQAAVGVAATAVGTVETGAEVAVGATADVAGLAVGVAATAVETACKVALTAVGTVAKVAGVAVNAVEILAAATIDTALATAIGAVDASVNTVGWVAGETIHIGVDIVGEAADLVGHVAGTAVDAAANVAGDVVDTAGHVVGAVAGTAGAVVGGTVDAAGHVAGTAAGAAEYVALDASKYIWQDLAHITTKVHSLIALDMKAKIDAHYGLY